MDKLNQMKASLEAIAGGELRVELIKGCYYAFGSELQCLRMERAYPRTEKFKADYSVNLDTWFFRIEL